MQCERAQEGTETKRLYETLRSAVALRNTQSNELQAGLRAHERSIWLTQRIAFPHRTMQWRIDSLFSLTVAGAAPDLRDCTRTGFPFHSPLNIRTNT